MQRKSIDTAEDQPAPQPHEEQEQDQQSQQGEDSTGQQVDQRIEETRKRRRILQRDLQRLSTKFDSIKEHCFNGKDWMLQQEIQMVQNGTHPELKRRLQSIKAVHDQRLQVARNRLQLQSQCHHEDYKAQLRRIQSSLAAETCALNWQTVRLVNEMAHKAQWEHDGFQAVNSTTRSGVAEGDDQWHLLEDYTVKVPMQLESLSADAARADIFAIRAMLQSSVTDQATTDGMSQEPSTVALG